MTWLLLLGLIALGVVVRRQAQRIDALEQAMGGAEAPIARVEPAALARAARVILAETPVAEAPVPAFETERDAPPAGPAPASASAIFEQLVGGKLPIWVGGAALAIAGYFLVRLAIESGLLTPAVRVLLASLFGIALLVASEAAARLPRVADDARVNQALAGAGIATLYAAAYLAGSHYGLIGPIAAFAMMAAVTALALGLSLRRGAPTALMGLVGGFATPLLAGAQGEAIVPLLAYLGLLSAGLFGLAAARGWLWLALSAAVGSLLWSGLLIATAAPGDALAAGAFALLLAVAATLATAAGGGERAGGLLRALPLVAAAAELAVLIATTGFGPGAWSLYLLLAAATILLAWREARLTAAVAAALLISAVALASGGFAQPATAVTLVAATGIALLFGGAGHALARRAGDGIWWAGIGAAGLAAPYAVLGVEQPKLLPEIGWAGIALLLALPPLHLAWRSRDEARASLPFDPVLAIGAAAAAAFLAAALAVPLPVALLPAAILVAAVALAEGARRIADRAVAGLAVAAAAVALLVMFVLGGTLLPAAIRAVAGGHVLLPLLPRPIDGVWAGLLPAALLAIVAYRAAPARSLPWRMLLAAAAVAAAVGLYILWKQLFAIRSESDFVAAGFLERAILTQALFAAGRLAEVRGWRGAARALTAAAVARLVWFDLAVCNPAFVAQAVGQWPLLNLVALHFLAAVAWIEPAWRAEPAGRGRLLALAALVAVAAGGTLLSVRQAFHGTLLNAGTLGRPEFYAYSAAGVVLASALFARGAWLRDRPLRIAGLGLLTLMVLKVFLVDAAALAGGLRIASFLGLGVMLIGIGWAYGRFLGPAAAPDPAVRA